MIAPITDTMIKHNRYSPTRSMIAIIIVIVQYQRVEPVQHAIAKPGCQDSCGGVPIPYPFGIGSNCFLEGFQLTCNTTFYPPKPYLFNVAVQNISISLGQASVTNHISSLCYNPSYKNVTKNTYELDLSGTPFRFNNEKNKITVIGCNTLAYIQYGNETAGLYQVGCILSCANKNSITTNGPCCAAFGCCQKLIPKQTNYYKVSFYPNYNNSDVYNFSRCSYAVLMEDNGFEFSSDYITTDKLYKKQMPVALDRAIGNETCDIAQANRSSYACISDNSLCGDSTNGPGYFCKCLPGYEGNPYLGGGCQDIDECAHNNPCSEQCRNLPGTYRCSCPAIMRSRKSSAAGECELSMPIIIGISTGMLLVVFLGFCMCVAFERKHSKVKKKYIQLLEATSTCAHLEELMRTGPSQKLNLEENSDGGPSWHIFDERSRLIKKASEE